MDLQASGHSHRTIAATLTDEGVRTPTGLVRWHHGSIAGYLTSAALDPPQSGVDSTSSAAGSR